MSLHRASCEVAKPPAEGDPVCTCGGPAYVEALERVAEAAHTHAGKGHGQFCNVACGCSEACDCGYSEVRKALSIFALKSLQIARAPSATRVCCICKEELRDGAPREDRWSWGPDGLHVHFRCETEFRKRYYGEGGSEKQKEIVEAARRLIGTNHAVGDPGFRSWVDTEALTALRRALGFT